MRIISTIIFLFCLISVYAQNGVIQGIVADNESGDNISFATVSVFDGKFNRLLEGEITDVDGKFEIDNLEFGEIQVVVSFTGYEPDTLSGVLLTRENSPLDIGKIGLLPAVVQLEDLNVNELLNTTSREIDRQTYLPQDYLTAQGGTAQDVLNKLPSVAVSPEGRVSARGTREFFVYLNGKPTHMNNSVLLGQIAAESIKSIDIITVPSARYDAQGKGGIINISTIKREKEGLLVAGYANIGGAPWGNLTDNSTGFNLNDNRYSGGVNLAFKNKKIALYSGLNYNKQNVNGSRTGNAGILQSNNSYFHIISDGNRPEQYENFSANAGIDLNFSEWNELSANYFYGHRTENRWAFYKYHTFFADQNKSPNTGIDPLNRKIFNRKKNSRIGIFHSGNIDFTHRFVNNAQLQFSLLYEHSELKRQEENRDFEYSQKTDNTGKLVNWLEESDNLPLDGYRFSAVFEKELFNGDIVGVGFQPELVSQSGRFKYDTLDIITAEWGTDIDLANRIDFTRAVYAGYVDYAGGWGDFTYIAGLRLEYTDRSLELENPEYPNSFERSAKPVYEFNQLNWFPTLHVRYDLNDNNAFIFAADRRINRPSVINMAPFLYHRRFEDYTIGNTELEPEYISNIELSLDKQMGKQGLTLTGFIRGTENAMWRVNTVSENRNVLIRSFANAGSVRTVGGEVNADLTAGSNAKIFLGGSIYNVKVQGDIFGYYESNRSTNWKLNGNLNLWLSPELKFTLDADVRSATVTPQGEKALFYLSNAALNYTPEKLENWNFGMKVLDYLSSNSENYTTSVFNPDGVQIFYDDAAFNRFGPIVELGVTYSLDKIGIIGKKAQSTFGKEQF